MSRNLITDLDGVEQVFLPPPHCCCRSPSVQQCARGTCVWLCRRLPSSPWTCLRTVSRTSKSRCGVHSSLSYSTPLTAAAVACGPRLLVLQRLHDVTRLSVLRLRGNALSVLPVSTPSLLALDISSNDVRSLVRPCCWHLLACCTCTVVTGSMFATLLLVQASLALLRSLVAFIADGNAIESGPAAVSDRCSHGANSCSARCHRRGAVVLCVACCRRSMASRKCGTSAWLTTTSTRYV